MIIAAIAALTYAIPMILLVFAGVLLTVLLRAAGTWLSERSRLPTKWSQKTFEFFVPFCGYFSQSSLDRITASAISRMERRVFLLGHIPHHERRLFFYDTADQTIPNLEIRFLPILFAGSFRGLDHQFILLAINQHDRADARLHHLCDNVDDELEDFFQITP